MPTPGTGMLGREDSPLGSFMLGVEPVQATARVTQFLQEVVYAVDPVAHVTSVVAEVIYKAYPISRVSSFVAEVLSSVTTNPTIKYGAVSQNLGLSQSFAKTVILIRSMNQTFTFSETTVGQHDVSSNHTYNKTLSDTLTFTETISEQVTFKRSISETLALTQTVDAYKVVNEDVSDTLSIAQSVEAYKIVSADLSDTFGFTETVVGVASFPATNTLDFTETLNVEKHYNRNSLQVLAFTESVDLTIAQERYLGDLFQFTQAVSTTHVHNLASLHVLPFSQTVTESSTKYDAQTLNISQTVDLKAIRSRSLTQTLTFVQTISTNRDKIYEVDHTLVFNQSALVSAIFVTCDSASLASNPLGDIVLGSECDPGQQEQSTLTFGETIGLQRIFHRTIAQSLSLDQTLGRPILTFDRTITDTFKFFEGQFKRQTSILGPDGIRYEWSQPVAQITKVQNLVILYASSQTIVLPAPDFNDTSELVNSVAIKRSMSGKFYSFVKTSDRGRLNYTFLISTNKAHELRIFVENNLSEIIRLENWKGEIYVGRLLTSPVEFTTTERYSPSFERVSVSLEFEGVRVHG